MTIRYVGIGGSDSNDGLSWANRKLTLNGVEDTPVVAGDTVYVGPGTYREMLTADVDGSAGNIITYIGDVTGEHTDGLGGIVRITGSDDDITATRAGCINSTSPYRTFRGFSMDITTSSLYYINGKDHIIFEDCNFSCSVSGIMSEGAGISNITIRRCIFNFLTAYGVTITHTAQVVTAAISVENCIFVFNANGFFDNYIEGITIKNCTFMGNYARAVRSLTSTAANQITINNCIFAGNNSAIVAANTDQITENYNTFFANTTPRTLTNTGGNSLTYPPLFDPLVLLATMKYPHNAFALAPYSPIRSITGTNEATDDLYGITRPATASKKSWGAVQYDGIDRSNTQAHAGTYSMRFTDAKRVQFIVPVSAVSTTISVYVYREANYAGTNPQMIIRQPGQSARTTTDTGSSGGWNQLTDTFTPASGPPYVIVELVSNNTATSGSFNVYFDDLQVS